MINSTLESLKHSPDLCDFCMQGPVHQKPQEARGGAHRDPAHTKRPLLPPGSGTFFQNIWRCVPGRRVDLSMTHLQRCSAGLLGRRQTWSLARLYPCRSACSRRDNLKTSLHPISGSLATSSVTLGGRSHGLTNILPPSYVCPSSLFHRALSPQCQELSPRPS